jgi:PAS domain S-box-containing protein
MPAAPAGWKSFLVRTALPAVLAMLLFIVALFQILIPAIEKNSMAHKREMIRELTNAAWNILARLQAEEQHGRLSQQQAQQMAVAQISTLRYGQQMRDYFWIHDIHPRMIMHPYRTDLNGRDLTDFTTPDGRRIFVEMRDIVRQSGFGFVQYPWQGQGDHSEVVPKVSYIKGFEPWGWILGTGINLNDVRTEIARLMRHVIAISVVILFVVALLLGFLSLQNLRLERQRTSALQALQASADQYRTIFETTGTAMVIIEDDLRLSLVNSEFEKLSGYVASEVVGRKLMTDLVIPEDRQRLQAYHYARRADPPAAPRNYEFGLCTRQGRVRNLYMTVALVPHTRTSVGSFLDMTDHKKALEVLAESEERFRSLVENALTGIFIIQDNQVVYANPEQKRLFGPLPNNFTITNVDKVHGEDQAAVLRFYADVLSGQGQTLDIDYRFYSRGRHTGDPELKWAHCRATPIEYMGKPSVLVNMTDVTRAKELEYLLSVKDKMISLGHVAAGIAHEIRNPLSGINIFMDAIRENFEDPASAEDIKGLITQAQAAAGRIESVVKAVLDFARPGTPHFEPADINVAVAEAVKLSQATLRKADIGLETELQQGLPLVSLDLNQIEQVMLNLITNAADALKSIAGRRLILISSAERQDAVVIRVADSGAGIPPENRRKVFDPFYTTRKDGSGIGLCICQRIITDHKGTITVDQSRWGGAEFVIRIPINNQTPEASNA